MEILWLVFLFAVVGAGPPLLFAFLVRKGRRRLCFGLLAVLAIASVATALNLTYGIGAGIFGAPLSCLVFPAVALSLIVVIATRANTWRLIVGDPARRRLYILGVVFIPLLQLAPVAGEIAIVATCDGMNRRAGDVVVPALQAYRDQNQAYADDLTSLVPGYIDELPPAHCFEPFIWFHGPDAHDWVRGSGGPSSGGSLFDLRSCPNEGATLLTVPSIRFEFIQRYNLETGVWSRVSFLDGVCSYLR